MYLLVNEQFAIEKGPIEIIDFSSKAGDFLLLFYFTRASDVEPSLYPSRMFVESSWMRMFRRILGTIGFLYAQKQPD